MRTRKHSLPWIDNKIRRLIKTRSYYLTKATKSRSLADWEKYKSVRNKLNSELRKAKLASISSSSNPRDVWRDMNKLIGRAEKEKCAMLKLHGRDVTDSLEITEAFDSHFAATVCIFCCTSDGNPLQWNPA